LFKLRDFGLLHYKAKLSLYLCCNNRESINPDKILADASASRITHHASRINRGRLRSFAASENSIQ